MMISPGAYREIHKDDSLEELQKEREELIDFMTRYENHELSEEAYMIHPSPSVMYSCYKEYFRELMKLIEDKLPEGIGSLRIHDRDFMSKETYEKFQKRAKDMGLS